MHGGEALPELRDIMHKIKETYDVHKENVGVGSTIFAVKPGDGSAQNRLHHVRKFSVDGLILPMNMLQRDIVQTLSTGACFHL